jgi:hypothetical protein
LENGRGRLQRVEWLDTRTGATRQETVGGPFTSTCPLTIVSDGREVSSKRDCVRLAQTRFRRKHVWYTADFLLARRLVEAGTAHIVGSVTVDDLRAVRVVLPPTRNPVMPIRYADVEPASMLSLRLVYAVEGRRWGERVYLRRIPRAAFPREFFTP